MSMNKKTETAANASPAFEGMDDGAATPTASVSRAVATAKPSAVAVSMASGEAHVIAQRKAVDPIDYDTFEGIVVEKGFFTKRGSTDNIGSELIFNLETWQNSFVCTPKDTSAPFELVRYSNDGITCSDGTSMMKHLESLRDGGYPNAKIEHRIMISGELESAKDAPELLGKIVSITLAPSSRKKFTRFQTQSAFDIAKGRKTPDQALRMKLTCTVEKYEKNTYGVCNFDFAD